MTGERQGQNIVTRRETFEDGCPGTPRHAQAVEEQERAAVPTAVEARVRAH
jgi:hypothetical protein